MMDKSIAFGCFVGVLSLAAQSIGLTLQRKSHITEALNQVNPRPPYRRPLWRLGCFLFIVSNVFGSSIQISTLPLIVLSPLQAVGLVFNSICGSLILNESFTKFTFRGTLLVSIGAFLIGYFGSIPEPNHNLEELLLLLKRKPFLIWFYISVGLLISILCYISYLNYKENVEPVHLSNYGSIDENNTSSSNVSFENNSCLESDPLLPLARCSKDSSTSIDSSQLSFFNNLKTSKMVRTGRNLLTFIKAGNIPYIQGILYGVVCGILSAHALLLAKSAVELIIVSITEKTLKDIKSYQSWLIIFGWSFCAVMQVYYLNLGLKIISSSIIFPLIFCVYNIVNIINGLIYLDQFNKLQKKEILMIFIGVCLILFGVFYLSVNDIMMISKEQVNAIEQEEIEDIDPPRSPLSHINHPFESFHEINADGSFADDTIGEINIIRKNDSGCSPFSKTNHSVKTNVSIKPIVSESFDGNKLKISNDK